MDTAFPLNDDPRWAWLETRLAEIHADVRKINGNVRQHDKEIVLLQSMAHQKESCPIVHRTVEEVTLLKQHAAVAERTKAVLIAVATVVGGTLVVIAQIIAQKFWH